MASRQEVEFLLSHVGRYLSKRPSADDVRSVFAGLRPLIGGASVTASHLAFTSGQNGIFYAFDDRTGKTLWTANVGLATGSAPVIYAVKGTEYVAIVLGGSAVTGAPDASIGATKL